MTNDGSLQYWNGQLSFYTAIGNEIGAMQARRELSALILLQTLNKPNDPRVRVTPMNKLVKR